MRLDDEVWSAVNALPGSTINDKLRGHLLNRKVTESPADSAALLEILEHVQTIAARMPDGQLLDAEHAAAIVEDTMQQKIDERKAQQPSTGYDPRSVPGIQQGAPTIAAKYLRGDGSRMSYAERKQVDEREHLEVVARADTVAAAAGRSDIDYNPAS